MAGWFGKGSGATRAGQGGIGLGRLLAGPLLALNFCLSVVVLGLAGWILNRQIGFGQFGNFGGNAASPWLTLFSLLAGMASIASIIAGLHHLRYWNPESGAAAQATAWISWLFLVLAFCLAWKEVRIGMRGRRYKALEAFVIILTFTKFLYTLSLYLDENNRENKARDTTGRKVEMPAAPTMPAAASAV